MFDSPIFLGIVAVVFIGGFIFLKQLDKKKNGGNKDNK